MPSPSFAAAYITWSLVAISILNGAVLAMIFAVKLQRERRERAAARIRDELTEALIPFFESGGTFVLDGRTARIGEHRIVFPPAGTHASRVAVSTAVSFIAAIKGEGQERLIAMLQSAGYVQSVARSLRSRSPVQRAHAAMLLGGMHARGAREALLERFLNDSSAEVRIVAAEALGEMGDAPSVPILLDAIRQPTRYQELRLAAVLSRFGLAAVPDLEHALSDIDERVVRIALDILTDIGMVIDPAPVVRALSHRSPEVRARAAELLGAAGAVDTIEALTAAAHDSQWFVRVRVVKALARLGIPDSTARAREWYVALAELLRDTVWYVRRHAAAALAAGGVQGIAMLELDGSDVSVAALQLHALRRGEASTTLL